MARPQHSFDEMIKEIVAEARQEAMAEFLAALDDLTARLSGTRKPGRPRSTAAAPGTRKPGRPAVEKSGPPQGEVYNEGGRGRKPCPNCDRFVAARSQDCPNCGWDFASGKVKTYKDSEGNEILLPFQKKQQRKKAVPANNAGNGRKRAEKPAAADDVDETALTKSVSKHLRKAKSGIKLSDLAVQIVKEMELDPKSAQSISRRVNAILKKIGAVQDKESKKWSEAA